MQFGMPTLIENKTLFMTALKIRQRIILHLVKAKLT